MADLKFLVMPTILHIETATHVCSVSVFKDDTLIAVHEENKAHIHSSMLVPFIQKAMKKGNLAFEALEAIAVSSGPGSFTGLRIGVTVAKGMCYILNIPLIGINTLQSMAEGCKKYLSDERSPFTKNDMLYCPMIDARRMEVYAAIFDENGSCLRTTDADIIDESSYSTFLEKGQVIFFGEGSAKCKEAFSATNNAIFIDSFTNSATHMNRLAEAKYEIKEFEDPASFEPFYLKNFIPGKPKRYPG